MATKRKIESLASSSSCGDVSKKAKSSQDSTKVEKIDVVEKEKTQSLKSCLKGISVLVMRPVLVPTTIQMDGKDVEINTEKHLPAGARVWWFQVGDKEVHEGTYIRATKRRKISNACVVLEDNQKQRQGSFCYTILSKRRLFLSEKSNSSEEETLISKALSLQNQLDSAKSERKVQLKKTHAKCKQAMQNFQVGDKVMTDNLDIGFVVKKNRVNVVVRVGDTKWQFRASTLRIVP